MAEDDKTNLSQPKKVDTTPSPSGIGEKTKTPGCEVLDRFEVEAGDILDQLPKKQREKLLRIVTSHSVMKHYEGPLPPPEDIALYNQYITNGADRIMTMAEEQAGHRREMERSIIICQNTQSSRGQLFGLFIGVFGIVAGAIVALMGHDMVGGGIAGATVISLVYAFITGQKAQRQESTKSQPSSGNNMRD